MSEKNEFEQWLSEHGGRVAWFPAGTFQAVAELQERMGLTGEELTRVMRLLLDLWQERERSDGLFLKS